MRKNVILDSFIDHDYYPTKYNFFCDMDGVLCFLDKMFTSCSGESVHGYAEKYGVAAFWKFPDTVGEPFWSDMEWQPGGKDLWNYIKKYNPTILSAPSRQPSCHAGKLKWLIKNIPELPNHNVQTKSKYGWDGTSKIILNSDKFRYVKDQYDILIDDTQKKIDAWNKAGGTGILHTSAENSINQLKTLGL